MDPVDQAISQDLQDRADTTDCLNGKPGHELGTVGTALAHVWRPNVLVTFA
jgi:hypothetical protein